MSEPIGDTLFDWLGGKIGIDAHMDAVDDMILELIIVEQETDR